MCGGASSVLVGRLNFPADIQARLKINGLSTAQDILDEGSEGLLKIGIPKDDIAIVSEIIHKETDQHLD